MLYLDKLFLLLTYIWIINSIFTDCNVIIKASMLRIEIPLGGFYLIII